MSNDVDQALSAAKALLESEPDNLLFQIAVQNLEQLKTEEAAACGDCEVKE